MAIDVAALKAKLDKMNNQGKGKGNFPSHLWKPDYGTYTVRIVPWPDDMEAPERPFVERWFYYGLGGRMVASNLGDPDPVRELRDLLFADRTPDNLELAKKLRPKMRAFVPIIVRDDDNKTEVKIWSIGQGVYKQLLGYLIDTDWGDITDIEKGRDLTVKITDSGKKFPDGTVIRDVNATCKPNPTPLFEDQDDLKVALEGIPDLDEIYPRCSYEKLSDALDRFVDGGVSGRSVTRGGATSARSQEAAAPAPKTASLEDEFDSLLNG